MVLLIMFLTIKLILAATKIKLFLLMILTSLEKSPVLNLLLIAVTIILLALTIALVTVTVKVENANVV